MSNNPPPATGAATRAPPRADSSGAAPPRADTSGAIPVDALPAALPDLGLALAESLVTRLCHDLSGAMSTIANALEIATEEADAGNEALEIASEGSTALTSRLRLLRAAWGGGSGAMTMAELLALTEGLPAPRRVRIDADLVSETGQLPPGLGRILLNVLLMAAESLPHGGAITLSGSVEAGIVVMIAGRSAAWPPGLPGWLATQQTAWGAIADPRRLSGPLTALLAAAEGVTLSMLMGGAAGEVPPLLLRPALS